MLFIYLFRIFSVSDSRIIVPGTRLGLLQRAFTVTSFCIWNFLTTHVRSSLIETIFLSKLKTQLFSSTVQFNLKNCPASLCTFELCIGSTIKLEFYCITTITFESETPWFDYFRFYFLTTFNWLMLNNWFVINCQAVTLTLWSCKPAFHRMASNQKPNRRKMTMCPVFGTPKKLSDTVLPTSESVIKWCMLLKHQLKSRDTIKSAWNRSFLSDLSENHLAVEKYTCSQMRQHQFQHGINHKSH